MYLQGSYMYGTMEVFQFSCDYLTPVYAVTAKVCVVTDSVLCCIYSILPLVLPAMSDTGSINIPDAHMTRSIIYIILHSDIFVLLRLINRKGCHAKVHEKYCELDGVWPESNRHQCQTFTSY